MNRPSALVHAVSLVVFATLAALGCNGVLGNEEGTPRPDAGAATLDSGLDGSDEVVCASGKKDCFGLCVETNQPSTGCGGKVCNACDPQNVVASACEASAEAATFVCGYSTCQPAFGNCDSDKANGCETSLGRKLSCGSCTTKCQLPTPVCALDLSGNQTCAATCPPGASNCSDACVDTQTSIENCGACGVECSRTLASATCVAGSCKYVCDPGAHLCGADCVSDANPDNCGSSCTPCPAGGNHTKAICSGGMCGTACRTSFVDCDNGSGLRCELSCPPCGGSCSATEKCCNEKCLLNTSTCPPAPAPM